MNQVYLERPQAYRPNQSFPKCLLSNANLAWETTAAALIPAQLTQRRNSHWSEEISLLRKGKEGERMLVEYLQKVITTGGDELEIE
ncbi:MAG: hypothetical protein ACFE7R_04965, partial [Candidatus Hodarchaeota archaeon]